LLSCVFRPLVDAVWWEKTRALAQQIAGEFPANRLRFALSGRVREVIQGLLS
jgi:hypothetical protein